MKWVSFATKRAQQRMRNAAQGRKTVKRFAFLPTRAGMYTLWWVWYEKEYYWSESYDKWRWWKNKEIQNAQT